MADLIDRRVLLQGVDANISNLRDLVGEDSMLNRAIDLVQHTRDFIAGQTAVEAIEVVRCKDCEHWNKEKLYCIHPAGMCFCGKRGEKGFCCFGERKEGAE